MFVSVYRLSRAGLKIKLTVSNGGTKTQKAFLPGVPKGEQLTIT